MKDITLMEQLGTQLFSVFSSLIHFAEMPLCFLFLFPPVFVRTISNSNLIMPEPIVFKCMSVMYVSHGHGKIPMEGHIATLYLCQSVIMQITV